MTIALVDGDIAAYRASSIKTEGMEDEDGTPGEMVFLSPTVAADIACKTVEAWTRQAGCTTQLLAFTGQGNWRKVVMPSYKANRAGMARPIHLGTVRRTMCERFDHRVVDGLEADDILGVLATRPAFAEAIIVSPDKDLRTVPGRHLSPLKDDGVVPISAAEANRRWLLQTLTGDVSDGYTGIPRVGPVKAAKVLGNARTVSDMWAAVVQAYLDHGLTEADALMTARVARILRDVDYSKSTKSIRLWHPTTPEWLALGSLRNGV
jgi:5'-3' exonuclease